MKKEFHDIIQYEGEIIIVIVMQFNFHLLFIQAIIYLLHFRKGNMKAPKGVCSQILLILITICELKIQKVAADFLAALKEELNVPPIPETEIVSAADDAKDGVEKPFFSFRVKAVKSATDESVTEDTSKKLNDKVNTLALTALHQNTKVKVCCPKSLIEWKKKHEMETSETFSNCKVNITEPERRY